MGRSNMVQKPEDNRSQDGGATSRVGTVAAARLEDFQPDGKNANAGTERGRGMLEDSMRRHGAGRSILVDKSGRIIAGNHVAEVAADLGLNDCIIVPTDGRKLVVVQRTDLDLDSPAARALAIADNRTSEVGLRWDTDVLAELAADECVDLSALFSSAELADLLHDAAPVPKFEPVEPNHRLDELKPHCATCSCRKAGAV